MKFLCNIELTRKSGGSEPVRNIINNIGNSFYAASDTLYVSPGYSNYPAPYYDTISDAITAASAGDTIIVYPGSYDERLSVTKNLNFYFYPGAVLAPTDDTGTTIFSIGSGATVNIDGSLVIHYEEASSQPTVLNLGRAVVNMRIDSITGTSSSPIQVYHPDAEITIELNKLGVDDDYFVTTAKYFHIKANEAEGQLRIYSGVQKAIVDIRLHNGVIYSSSADCVVYNCDGNVYHITGGKMTLHNCYCSHMVNAEGGELLAYNCNFVGVESTNGVVNIDQSACRVKLYDTRIENLDAGTGGKCINMTGAFSSLPVVIKDCIMISGNATALSIGGTSAQVYNWDSISTGTIGAGITVSFNALTVDPLVSEF